MSGCAVPCDSLKAKCRGLSRAVTSEFVRGIMIGSGSKLVCSVSDMAEALLPNVGSTELCGLSMLSPMSSLMSCLLGAVVGSLSWLTLSSFHETDLLILRSFGG